MGVSRIFWDTNLFVYLFEDYGELSQRVVTLRQRMLERNDELCTSTLTLGEVLVKQVEARDEDLARRYEEAITTTATIVPFTRETARVYAVLRRDRALRPPGRHPARLRGLRPRRPVHHERRAAEAEDDPGDPVPPVDPPGYSLSGKLAGFGKARRLGRRRIIMGWRSEGH